MTLLDKIAKSILILKVLYIFYNQEQKEGTLKIVEREIFTTLLENEHGKMMS